MLLTFLWSCQKSGPYKMYMALRTFQKKIMSPNPGNNSSNSFYCNLFGLWAQMQYDEIHFGLFDL